MIYDLWLKTLISSIRYKQSYKVYYMAIGLICRNNILMPTAGGTLKSFHSPPYDRPQNDHAIAKFYFLALTITSGVIMYGHFPHLTAPAEDFTKQLIVDLKAIRFKGYRPDQRGLEGFVTSFIIGRIKSIQHVGQ